MPEVCDASISNKDESQSVFSNLVHRIRELPKIGRKCTASSRIDGDGRTVRGQKQHRRACLQCLPPELLHMIFVEACTDGGRTGCALSLVSKDIRALSRAARFYSVSLLSPSLWKLLRFLHEYGKRRDTAIQGKPPHSMPHIRHLCLLVDIPNQLYHDRFGVKPAKQDYLHCDDSLQQRLRDHILDNLRRGPREWRELPEELVLEIIDLESAYCRAVAMLLDQVAGDLYSLCLYQFPHIRDRGLDCVPPPCATTFPNLRELWLGGRDARETSLFHRDTRFPALKRLHVRADIAPDIKHWLSVAPRLDSLQIFARPRLLSDRDGGWQRLRAVAAHPVWRGKGKQLTIQVPVPLGKHDDPFAWAHFGQRASAVRQELADAARPLVFVPCYAAQDVDGRVCRDVEDPAGRRRFWPPAGIIPTRTKPAAQDELFRRDWLARIGGWQEGIYVEDFWARFVGDGEGERKRIAKTIGPYAWPSDEPTYVAPLVIRADAV